MTTEESIMKRIDKKTVGLTTCLASLALAGAVAAGPAINGAAVLERVFNDCPGSMLTTTNLYPASITITDVNPNCPGFANLHMWRLSEDGGMTPALFLNGDGFSVRADLVISGTGQAEAGLQVSPWWTNVDGRLNVRTTDGEIAAFGGRLPFYSFSGAPHNLSYVKGNPIGLEIIYIPNGLSMGDPGTIEYKVTYNAVTYSSGVIPFDQGNPAEDPPYGLWGILNNAGVGGHLQFFVGQSGAGNGITADWRSIAYTPHIVGVQQGSWSQVKGLYR
jgi:hypothetical protein